MDGRIRHVQPDAHLHAHTLRLRDRQADVARHPQAVVGVDAQVLRLLRPVQPDKKADVLERRVLGVGADDASTT